MALPRGVALPGAGDIDPAREPDAADECACAGIDLEQAAAATLAPHPHLGSGSRPSAEGPGPSEQVFDLTRETLLRLFALGEQSHDLVHSTRTRSGHGNGQATLAGERIRRLRTQAGKTLRAQAREIGIAPSSLSALENNQGGVSLKRLQLVAAHFGLSVTDLLGATTASEPLGEVEVIRRCASSVRGVRRGRGVLYQLVGSSKNHALQPYLLSFEPGGSYERDMIAHFGEEFAYVLEGEVELLVGEERHHLVQGDSVRFPSNRPHAFRNASALGVAMVIGAATPPW